MIYNKFVHNIYFPITEFVKGESVRRYLSSLEASQYYSRDELCEIQWEKLKNLLDHAYRKIPYYQDLFKKNGIHPNDVKSAEVFSKLPLLTKEAIVEYQSKMLDLKYHGKIYRGTTSGSSGKPLDFAVTSEYNSWDWASRWRGRQWFGINIGDREVAIWGRPVNNKFRKFWDPVKAIFRNTLLLSGFEVSEKTLYWYSKLLFFYNPEYIYSYSTTIYQLANYIQNHYSKVQTSKLKAIFVTAETLYPNQRQVIEEVFNVPVSNEYGCSEIGGFVYECPHGNWHISAENVYVEFVSIDGGPKEIVATSLTNFYMPFIRYRIGDLGESIEEICPCGINLPLMKFKAGKTTDVIVLKSGRKLTSEIFLYLTRSLVEKKCQPFKNFRIIQKEIDKFEILFERGAKYSEEGIITFKTIFINILKEKSLNIIFTEVEKIPKDQSGKIRYFISEIKK